MVSLLSSKGFMAVGLLLATTVLAEPPLPKVVAVENPRQEEVFRYLDQGGDFSVYFESAGDFAFLGQEIQKLLELYRPLVPEMEGLPLEANRAVATLGLNELEAMGLSSRRLDNGLYLGRGYLHLPDGRRGLMKLLDGPVRPFASLKLAPADAAFVFEIDVQAGSVIELARESLHALFGEDHEISVKFEADLQRPANGMTMAHAFEKLSTRWTLIARASETGGLQLPDAPEGFPGIEFLVLADNLSAEDFGQAIPTAMMAKHGDYQFLLMPAAQPVFFGFHEPSGRMFISSSLEFAEVCFKGENSLEKSAEFRPFAEYLYTEGNAFSYVGPSYFALIRRIMMESGMDNPMSAPFRDYLMMLYGGNLATASVSVERQRGVESVSVGPMSSKHLVYLVPVYGVGLMSAMAIPAFQAVRENSVGGTMDNDALQIAAAAAQYFVSNPKASEVAIAIDPSSGSVEGPLSLYVPQVTKGVMISESAIPRLSSIKRGMTAFTLSHPQYKSAEPIAYDRDGKRQ